MFALLMYTGCKNNCDLNTRTVPTQLKRGNIGTRLRITKFQSMNNRTFIYNSKGQLSEIDDAKFSLWKYCYIFKFEYNSKNNPISMTSLTYNNNSINGEVIDLNELVDSIKQPIKWFTNYRFSFGNRIFELNTQNQLVKETDLNGSNPVITNYKWRGDNLCSGNYMYKYMNRKSPFTGINIAIILICNEVFHYNITPEYQNSMCLSTDNFACADTFKYVFNAQNYPIQMVAVNNMCNVQATSETQWKFTYESY